MAQGYTLDIKGLTGNDSARITGVTGLTLTGNSLAVTANGGNSTVSLVGVHSVKLFAGVTEFASLGNTKTASISAAGNGHFSV